MMLLSNNEMSTGYALNTYAAPLYQRQTGIGRAVGVLRRSDDEALAKAATGMLIFCCVCTMSHDCELCPHGDHLYILSLCLHY